MTRKDYIKIAGILSKYKNPKIIGDFCTMLKLDNPRFIPKVFWHTCGYTSNGDIDSGRQVRP